MAAGRLNTQIIKFMMSITMVVVVVVVELLVVIGDNDDLENICLQFLCQQALVDLKF